MELRMENLKNLSSRHRGVIIAAAIGIVLLAIFFSMLSRYRATGRLLAVKKAELHSFGSLAGEYLEKKAAIDMAARKARSASDPAGSAITEIERIGERVGASGLITSIKPLEERQAGGYIEKELEVRIEKIELNRLVNLLYLIENNKRLLVVREFSMKSRFENPDLLDIRLRISHLTRPQ